MGAISKIINTYKKNDVVALRNMWRAIVVLGLVQVIVSIAVAASNNQNKGGLKSATFAAIWSMFIVVYFIYQGYTIVMSNKNDPLLVGFMIGVAAMLAELCFMLAAVFFTLGEDASSKGLLTAPANKAYGVFSLFNFIFYVVWATLLWYHRAMVSDSGAADQQEEEVEDQEDVNDDNADNEEENQV